MKIRYLLIRYLANLQFAIILLLTIAGLSILGTIIEQNQSVEYYHINYAPELAKIFTDTIILQFGLDHIFRAWWFVGLLVLFGLSLMCCTFLQQFPILNSARTFKFYKKDKSFSGLPFQTKVTAI